VFALVCELVGPDAARDKLGANQSDGECRRHRDHQPSCTMVIPRCPHPTNSNAVC
jgi:hypothetical protein